MLKKFLALFVVAIVGLSFRSAVAEEGVKPFRIGISNDQSGLYADQGGPGSALAARMAAEDFGGVVLGRPIEILVADNQNKPDIARQIARRWFELDGVSAIADGGSSASGLAAQGVAATLGKVTLISGGTAPEFSGTQCSPYGTQWGPSSYSLANAVGRQLVRNGGRKWFFLTTDLVFGHALEAEATKAIIAEGGTVVGGVKHPFNTSDFSSFLMQSLSSGADVLAIAAGGADLVTAIRQAKEFRIPARIAAFYVTQAEVDAIGLEIGEGVRFATPFYWDLNDRTRSWARRFQERLNRSPTMLHANTYAAVTHYLKAVAAVGADDSAKVVAKMHSMPIEGSLLQNASILKNGRVIMDMFVVQVKNPKDSKSEADSFDIISTIPATDAYESADKSGCPLGK